VLLTHFSPWDYNWPYGPPPNSQPPNGNCGNSCPGPKPDKPPDDPCKGQGSIIGCEPQTLGEVINVTGTPLSLHYQSDRVPGRRATHVLKIRLSGATLPAGLQGIHLEIAIAGQAIKKNFSPQTNLIDTFTWDGKDAYGRPAPGKQSVKVRIGYEYIAQYYATPDSLAASFNRFAVPPVAIAKGGGGAIVFSRPAARIPTLVLWQDYQESLGSFESFGLGGWNLSVHHTYDARGQTLYLGSGEYRSATALGATIITTVAGTGGFDFSGDGGPATQAQLKNAHGVAVGSDGSLYLADAGNSRIRRVGLDGIITTVAGGGVAGLGDGGLATQAKLNVPRTLAVGPDGTMYIADSNDSRIRRVAPNGIITTMAGTGTFGFSGDGGPATQAQLWNPFGVALGPDGSLYIADLSSTRIRRVAPDGIITTVAGGGTSGLGDGGLATQAQLASPRGVAVGSDGSQYIADAIGRIRRVGPDGIINTVAGTGSTCFSTALCGDGGLATQAQFSSPWGVAVGSDGSLYIADQRIRRVGPDGIINTVAGGGTSGLGDGGPATQAQLNTPTGVAVGFDGSVYIADNGNRRFRQLRSTLPGSAVSDILIAAENGRDLFVFSGTGRHLRTHDALTGAVRVQFAYDSAGRLVTITDSSSNVTTIQRDGSGNPTAIVAPFGQTTTLAVQSDGYLSTITNPAGEAVQLTYSSGAAEGLLATMTDARGNLHSYSYDALGRLLLDSNPAGGTKTLARTDITDDRYSVAMTTALGRVTAYEVEKLSNGDIRRRQTDSSSALTETVNHADGSRQVTYADGTVAIQIDGPDPRFGMQAPFAKSLSLATPGGLKLPLAVTRAATLQDPANLLSLTALTSSATLNGRTFTSNYDGVARTVTTTTPVGRQIFLALDAKGRGIQERLHPGLTPVNYTYDLQGRVTQVQQGTLAAIYGYDAKSRVISRTDGTGAQTLYTYDQADRLASVSMPSGRTYSFSYDANGNRSQITMPNSAVHLSAYSTIDLETSYTPPGNFPYQTAYDIDSATSSVTLPSARILTSSYDAGGRFTGVSYPEAAVAFQYFGVTNRPSLITRTTTGGSPTQQMGLTYDANLVTGFSWNGPANGSYQYRRNNDFAVVGITLNANPETLLNRDNDGLIINHGTFSITRAGPTGAQSLIGDGTLALALGYDSLARQNNRAFSVAGTPIYQNQLSFDNASRVAQRIETLSGVSHTFDYSYDADGQLVQVKRDGTTVELYGYDLNGNRNSSKLGAGATIASTFDSQDRLQQRGAVNYQFDADGFLTQRGTDTFQYSGRGELLQSTVGGQTVTYAYDGLRRRVARTDTSGTNQYLYGSLSDPFQVTAMRDPSNVLSEYFYDDNDRLYAIHRGAGWYYVATDQVGTPRMVTNNTGAIQKIIEYDTFGNKTTDSNPAFELPIGFAGGLEDPVTKLVRFGFRDLEPESGRWTARDPLFFDGNQLNLYAYVGNYPVGLRDPSGLESVECLAWKLSQKKDDFLTPQQRARKARDEFFAKNGKHDANLRDADHFLFTREYARNYHNLGNGLMTAFTLGYTGAKFACLTCVEKAYELVGEDPNTSEASLDEIYWGIRGNWDPRFNEGRSPPPGCCKN
jgi:RHS repeat-associated protein